MSVYEKYEAVIGLEVHAQLLTKSKAYSRDSAAYGSPPNTNVSTISLGHPGTLPRLNRSMIDYAIKLGLACNCTINKENQFSRKNYFYADLPKGYQITQFDTPICTKGELILNTSKGEVKVGITRIHMEEDSGKSSHDVDPYYSLIDLNRAGVPLVEIVSEPDMRSSEEAYEYVSEIRKLVRYLDICDGNMEEGSLRCDANISVRLKGVKELGVKVEVKNMNSIRNVKRAIEFEIHRQIDLIEASETIEQTTMGFNAVKGETFLMRSKEFAQDYRYFPEPDLPPVILNDSQIEDVRKSMPALPRELFTKYTTELKLSNYDAAVLTDDKETAQYFEELITYTKHYKAASNWIMGPVRSYINENTLSMQAFPIKAEKLAELVELVEGGSLSHSAATQKLFPQLLKEPEKKADQLIKELNLGQDSRTDSIQEFVDQALDNFPEKVKEYRAGKESLVGLFMGEVMKLSKGKVDPKIANKILIESLKKVN